VVFSNPTDNLPSCYTGGIVNRDVWFQFLVPPDGSLVDFTIELTGVNGPNGSIIQPQIAVYRGECMMDELAELYCATAAPGQTSISLDLVSATPGLPLFLRISDWAASGTPNWGDFLLCVKPLEQVFNLGDASGTASCSGTLFDAGGPGSDYPSNENETFTVCPQEFTECIAINVVQVATEEGYDFLKIYAGDSTNDPLFANFDGFGSNVQLQVASQCVTFQFTSDASITDEGFELTWQCLPSPCLIAPPSTCANPTQVPSLPFLANGLTTCNAQNAVNVGPCDDDDWMQGEDVIFTYTSPGDECISVSITGSSSATAIGIFDACPSLANNCIAVEGGLEEGPDPVIGAAFLPTANTYYIMVDNPFFCTPFNIEINEVTCPVIMPSAAFCDVAQSLNGCGSLPSIVNIAPGQGDPDFLQNNINEGCWGGFNTPNFTFFYFEAQADGEFAFVLEAANPEEASDIDFQVWGPIPNYEAICEFATTTQPIRSSYAQGFQPTGLAHVNPISGLAVTDSCEQAGFPPLGGDGFLTPITVEVGEFYLVMINDYGNDIESGAISIDLSGTSNGILAATADFSVLQDTAICPGDSVQLLALGGEVYQWLNEDGLSCQYCPDPISTPSQSTTYHVAMSALCITDTLEVNVDVLNVDAGPDVTICLGEDIQIMAGSNFSTITYQWTAPAGFLDCMDCAAPIVTGLQPGSFTLAVAAFGPDCSFSDTMLLTVLPAVSPTYQISPDQGICVGASVSLGGSPTPGVTYSWSSSPQGFVSDQSNPMVSPSATTTYYLQATNNQCPSPSLDSVLVTVAEPPIFQLGNDTTICQGQTVLLCGSAPETGVTYQWSPNTGLSSSISLNATASPMQPTEYTLTASRMGCLLQESIIVDIIPIGISIQNASPLQICKGDNVQLMALAEPAVTTITWTPNDGSLNTNTGSNVVAAPIASTTYIASVTNGGCVKFDTILVAVDSLPWNLGLVVGDTSICGGETVLLASTPYNSNEFAGMQFSWTGEGLVSLDNIPSAVAQPTETTTYYRLVTNGACTWVDSITVTLITSSLTVSPDTVLNCGVSSIQLNAQASEAGGSYSWSNGSSIPNPIVELAIGSNTFTVVYTNSCGDSFSETIAVDVTSGPSVLIKNVADTVYLGAEVVLEADSMNAVTILWSNGSTADTAVVHPQSLPTTAYAVIVTDEFGCTAVDTMVLEVLEPVFEIPNAFSPNGDDTNDMFQVVIKGENVKVKSMQVWNRWGQLVFESKNENEGWDGRQDGRESPSDVYVYSILVQMPNGLEFRRKGDLTLLR
jgi:gliding motility-associated-like protein